MVEYTSSVFDSGKYNYNCITGDEDYLYKRLKKSIAHANNIYIIVAFLMESGVRLLIDDLKEAVKKGTTLRILCGNYLNITQPQALYLLKDSLGDKVDLRFYNVPNKSFHAKSYIFETVDESEIYVGSSNVSLSGLTSGIEWNYRLCSKTSSEDCMHFKQTFENLFLNHSIIVNDDELRKYSKKWKRPEFLKEIERIEDSANTTAEIQPDYIVDTENPDEKGIIKYPRPIGPQIEALYELEKTREEGWDKGLVVAATGVGKTFLSAFDSKEFNKVLFIAHRQEILFQAERTFKCVRPEVPTGFFFGEQKNSDCKILFATVQTLGRKEYLNDKNFKRDEFDYIVIDEFHHAVADSYKNVLEYFTPEFFLGLTATPERLDNQDVFALCDYNLVYEVRLKDAINKGWLVPFRYYGIYDETDYDKIDYRNGKYDKKQLEQVLNVNKRADLILHNYQKYNSKRALGFCSDRRHAIFMAKYFNEHNVKSCAVISGNLNHKDAAYIMDRKKAISKFKRAEMQVIFSVDIFNEGLDVPEVDTVMFLRPTESPTVFLQQLGRGLRKKGKKKYLNVLDFIGNYKKAHLIPFFLTGDIKDYKKGRQRIVIPDEEEYPEGCFVNFDFKIINLFKRMSEEKKSVYDRVIAEYFNIKEKVENRPLRLSMYTYMDDSLYSTIRKRTKLNIFKDYITFLKKIDELADNEIKLIDTKAHEFLKEIETTSMSKMYKMPVLLAFYNEGNMKISVSEDEIYKSFKKFYSRPSNAIDMLRNKSSANYKKWGKKEYISLARRNPLKYLMKSSSEFFYEKDGLFCLTPELKEFLNNTAFVRHYKDIIDFRTRVFYKERLKEKFAHIEKAIAEENSDNNG